jgi:putative membrane protein
MREVVRAPPSVEVTDGGASTTENTMSGAFALTLTAAFSLTLASVAQAQAPRPAPEPAPIAAPMPKAPAASAMAAATSPDSVFVTKAAEAGAKEVEVAKLGAAKAASSGVKAFAQRLVQDHTTLNTELTALAKSKDLKIPASTRPAPADLAKLSGAAFDKAFVALMIKEHDAAIALFEGESRDGRDAEVKEWAAKQLPALREHLTQAKSLKTKES